MQALYDDKAVMNEVGGIENKEYFKDLSGWILELLTQRFDFQSNHQSEILASIVLLKSLRIWVIMQL